MRDLSIFIDESGDLGETSEYYLLTLVMHDQSDSIDADIERYERSLPNHVGPLLNGHDDYELLDISQRRASLSCFRTFTQQLPFKYRTFFYRKSEYADSTDRLSQRMKHDVTLFLFDHLSYRIDGLEVCLRLSDKDR